ncbi:hypothetical protein INR49_016467 [Caranx melampygus]|nr:hypothetical protein INR49_016467 [Caranx melampygus]
MLAAIILYISRTHCRTRERKGVALAADAHQWKDKEATREKSEELKRDTFHPRDRAETNATEGGLSGETDETETARSDQASLRND